MLYLCYVTASDCHRYLGVSKNRGTPKSSILIGFSIINHPFWGTTIFGNIHLVLPIHLRGRLRRHLVLGASSADNFSRRTSLSSSTRVFCAARIPRMLLKTNGFVICCCPISYICMYILYIYIYTYLITLLYIHRSQ